MYNLTKNLKNFEDDGSSIYGFGVGGHDQTLFSIHARLLQLDLIQSHTTVYLNHENQTLVY